MASSFPVRTLTIASSHIYSYIYLPPNSSKPTILFLHGFPCTTQGWRKQISYFFALGYGILAPDLLGYGGTSKPDSVEKYNPKAMAAEVIQILAHEKIDKVTGVGHDWASRFLSRIANYYPDRLHAIAFLSVGYAPPAQKFDLDAAKDLLTRIAGYTPFGYWKFFATDEAAALIKKHVRAIFMPVP
jgi:pimeloyl-ACP methyl ester carboxylesterase